MISSEVRISRAIKNASRACRVSLDSLFVTVHVAFIVYFFHRFSSYCFYCDGVNGGTTKNLLKPLLRREQNRVV